MKVAFIGLGAMGLPMVQNVVKGGFDVSAYDVLPGVAESIPGVRPAKSIEDAVVGSSVAITMLPNTNHVADVILGPQGVAESMDAGTVVVDMSSISPIATREFASEVTKRGGRYLDAPVSGGVSGAASGTLSIMVGGDIETLSAVRSLLESMGTTINLVGPIGAGQGAKLCNQVVVACNISAVCEGLSLASALGLDLETVRQVIAGGAGQSWMLDNLGPKMLAGDDSAGFRISLQVKDLALALETAKVEAVPLPATAVANSMYLETIAHGEESNGNQSMYRAYERAMNRPIAREER